MLKDIEEFLIIDEQKVFFEEAFHLAVESTRKDSNQVVSVEGGLGTGKPGFAINLLVKLIKQGLVAIYVIKNVTPRDIYSTKLKDDFNKLHIDNLFMGSNLTFFY